jgi:hypothetical protein
MRATIFFILLKITFISCDQFKRNDNDKSINESKLYDTSSARVFNHKGMMEEVRNADSAVVMYYKTPGNPRFFSYLKLSKIDDIMMVVEDINKPFSDSVKGCLTNGKIYFYGKGDIVYPVYFSSDNSCASFSFIKTGEKYFVKMSPDSKSLLDNLKKKAKEL